MPASAPLLVPIVEGHGELKAVPLLVRRWLYETGRYVDVRAPVRASGRGALTCEKGIERFVSVARGVPRCAAILVVIDADEGCPAEEGPALQSRAETAAGGIPVVVVLAKHEFEAWLIASAETIRGCRDLPADLYCPADPDEKIGDPKAWISSKLPKGRVYQETVDQAPLTARMDFALVSQRSRSFRKLLSALDKLIPGS